MGDVVPTLYLHARVVWMQWCRIASGIIRSDSCTNLGTQMLGIPPNGCFNARHHLHLHIRCLPSSFQACPPSPMQPSIPPPPPLIDPQGATESCSSGTRAEREASAAREVGRPSSVLNSPRPPNEPHHTAASRLSSPAWCYRASSIPACPLCICAGVLAITLHTLLASAAVSLALCRADVPIRFAAPADPPHCLGRDPSGPLTIRPPPAAMV